MIHTDKGFGIVSKAEIDVFLELSCFFSDLLDVGNLISISDINRVISLMWYVGTNSLRKIAIICTLFLNLF